MKNIIEYLKINLDATYKKNIYSRHIFYFKFIDTSYRLEIDKINKISNPKLFIENYEDFKNYEDFHIEADGKACLSLRQDVLTPENLMLRVADWCKTLEDRKNGCYHSHGYRHGFAGVVEDYFSTRYIPLLDSNIDQVNLNELFGIARQNDYYKNKTKQELELKWKNILENWHEKMD